MERTRSAVIWTRIEGPPRKMGTLYLRPEGMELEYDPDYKASGLPGMSLMDDVATESDAHLIYPVTERIPVFPRLLALIPGKNPRNLQRAHYLKRLQQQLGHPPPPGIDTEWQLLLLGGHGGIGHIDLFTDDRAAMAWYDPGRESHLTDAESSPHGMDRSGIWGFVREQVLDESAGLEPAMIDDILGPTPSVGGMIPKLLVSIVSDQIALPDAMRLYPPDTPGMLNVLLKIEPPEYRGLIDLEAICLDIHAQAGFEVPRWWTFEHDGLRCLAVERFDQIQGQPIPMESLFSVIATANWDFQGHGDLLLEELGEAIQQLGAVITFTESRQGNREQKDVTGSIGEALYRRILMAYLTGNGDLHLDNLALLGGKRACRLSPVYDPAPMRAWPRHDLVSAIPYDASAYRSPGDAFIQIGGNFGLTPKQIEQCCLQALSATEHFAKRISNHSAVPGAQQTRLAGIAQQARDDLQGHLLQVKGR